MPVWRRLVDFFELRPFFTLWIVRVVWWLYIFKQIEWLTYIKWTTIIVPRGPSWFLASGWSNAFFTLLNTMVLLMTARLAIEVLLKFVMPSHDADPPRLRSWGQEALAFFDLRPFYTSWWLQLFWWLFLLSTLRTLYIYVIGNLPWSFQPLSVEHWYRWFRFGVGLLGPLTWLVGVRLLIEAALMSQPRTVFGPQ